MLKPVIKSLYQNNSCDELFESKFVENEKQQPQAIQKAKLPNLKNCMMQLWQVAQ